MKKLKKYTLIFIGVIVLAWLFFYVALVFVSSDLKFMFPPAMNLENIGAFGDSFNILTSLFTGLAFAGMAISIMYQIESVNEQTKDRKQARIEFEKQNKILEKQQREFQNQSFDNKFFQMIQLLNNIVARWTIEHQEARKKNTYRNNKVFEELRSLLEESLKSQKSLDSFYNIFNDFNTRNDTTMKYFFINLYQILQFIDTKNDTDLKKKHYADILRSQLSKDVLVLLFFNVVGLQNNIGREYLKLTKKYKFLQEIEEIDLNIEKELSKLLLEKYDITQTTCKY